ncbi:two-component regulator propeller domain-containing protein [Flavicella sp.]|uniref:hybrid sensor histidine kinase/response regulator transcription factor n=1 Tax=Flavicella sp. TaxID=2957742 RepID=UPI0030175BF4
MLYSTNVLKQGIRLVLVFFCFLSIQLNSQRAEEKYNFVNIKEEISKTGVFTILQDHEGFIWIGTNGAGLHRYDGQDYNTYIHEINDSTSISSSLVFCAQLDYQNRLWVGTEDGLNLYDREQDQFKKILLEKTDNESKGTIAIRSLVTDNHGNLFIGTYDYGLFKLDLTTFKVSEVMYISGKAEDEDKHIHCLAISNNGIVYAGTEGGLKKFNPIKNSIEPAVFETETGNYTCNTTVQSLLIDKQNDLWIGTMSDGLVKVAENATDDAYSIKKLNFSNNRIFTLIEIPDGTIMYGTENDGLINISSSGNLINVYQSDKKDKNSILSNSIWSLFLDNNDRIWMGYYNSGVGVYDKLYDKFKGIESLSNNSNSLQLSSVTGIAEDKKGNLWFAMDGGGIDIYNPNTKKIEHINNTEKSIIKGLKSLYVESLFVDSKHNIWVGSWNEGIFLLKNGAKEFINYRKENTNGVLVSNCISSFSEDENGTIWISTLYGGGLHTFSPSTEMFTRLDTPVFIKFNLHNKDIRKVLIDSDQFIWVGTIDGLFKITDNNGVFTVVDFSEKMSLEHDYHTSSNHILTLYEGVDKSIWIGTRGAGLCKYDKNKNQFIWYNNKNGQPLNNVNSIVESEDGNIWFSGNSGLCKFDKASSKFTKYTRNDGLLSNDFNINSSFRDRNGVLYFGNYQGVDYFRPDEILNNSNLLFSYLKGLKLFNKEVVPGEENSPLSKVISQTEALVLNHEQSVFTIEYSTVNFTRPEKNQYAYYLEGLETSWNYVGDVRSATYTNLDHGNYTFKLKSANNDGIWNEIPLELSIKILPPWWKSPWANLLYFGLFFFGLFLLNIMTNKRLKEKQLLENEREIRQQKEELNERKLQFFTNISHEFRTPLTLIKNPLEGIISDTSLNLPYEIQEKHRIIYKNTDRLNRLINELMDYRKLELNKVRVKIVKMDLVAFMKDICDYFSDESIEKKIQFNFDCGFSELFVWVDPGMLDKIIFNLLSNAFKVTNDGGKITLVVYVHKHTVFPLLNQVEQDSFEISISDTGPGLREDQLEKIFERFYQVDSLNKSYYSGTGIGLELVRSFIELHKGKIEVESELGKGTIFRSFFPMDKKHFTEEELSVTPYVDMIGKRAKFILPKLVNESPDQEEHSKLITQTLLIVEDNTELRNYLKKELRKQYKIISATNGKEGLKLTKEKQPDVILTDVMMPEMDGFEFCKEVKSNIATSHIPILMLTAKTMIEDWVHGIDVGADAYLHKPFDLRVLKSRLAQLSKSREILFDKYFSALVEDEAELKTTSLDKEFIHKVLTYIDDNLSDPSLSVDLLASQLFLSRSQFYRKIKSLTNSTAVEFIRKIRLERAMQSIAAGNTNINDVCYSVGFSTPSYFSKCFKKQFGILPTQVKQK